MINSNFGWRKAGIASVATTLVLGASLAGVGAASADAAFAFTRIAGIDRYDTAARAADAFDPNANDVILANGRAYADALSSNYLAGVRNDPILLTRLDVTPAFTLNQLSDSGVENITIVGGTGVVSAAQAASLTAAGYTVDRIWGANRYSTNSAIIAAGAASNKIGVIATGINFPDALAAGPVAFDGHALGLSRTNNIDDNVVAALEAAGVTSVLVLGGPSVVGPAVLTELAAAGITLEKRIFGADRSGTSTALADYAIANFGFTNAQVNVASGYAQGTGADALGGGPLTGQQNRAMLITRDVNNVGDLDNWLTAHAATLTGTTSIIFGGTGAVSAAAQATMTAAARTATSNQSYTVTPSGAQTKQPSTDGTTNEGAVTLTFSGITTPVNVATLPCDNTSTDANGATVFQDSDGTPNAADGLGGSDESDAVIESVNGAAYTFGTSYSPVNGSVTVVVDSTSYDCARVVVWNDADGGDDLDLDANNKPTEAFAVSGPIRWVPAEAANGTWVYGTVQYVDKDANLFVVDGETFKYDTNDTPYYDDSYRITVEEFETALSVGDQIDMWDGSYSRTAPNSFDLYYDLPGTPTGTKATVGDFDTNQSDTGANDVKVTWAAPSPADALLGYYNVYETDSAGDNWVLQEQTDDASTLSAVIENVSAGDHYYVVTAVSQADDEGDASNIAKATVVAPPAAATHDGAPLSTTAVYQDQNSNGTLDNGDILRVTFDETMAAPDALDWIELTDGDATVAEVRNGLNSSWALAADGKTIVITLNAAPVSSVSGSPAGIQYSADVTDSNGVTDTAASNTPAGAQEWDLVNSTDVTF